MGYSDMQSVLVETSPSLLCTFSSPSIEKKDRCKCGARPSNLRALTKLFFSKDAECNDAS